MFTADDSTVVDTMIWHFPITCSNSSLELSDVTTPTTPCSFCDRVSAVTRPAVLDASATDGTRMSSLLALNDVVDVDAPESVLDAVKCFLTSFVSSALGWLGGCVFNTVSSMFGA